MDEISKLHDEILSKVREYYHLAHESRQTGSLERINYAGRVFDEHEMVNLVDSALEFWLTYGRYSREFESKLAEYLGVRHVLLVNSGSSANLLAFAALTSPKLGDRQIRRGDEVITVACGFPTTVAPIIQHGAIPVFVDVEADTANVDVSLLEQAFSPKTKAVMLAHTLGNPFNLKGVKSFCDKHGLWLIEDNCDALGSRYDGKMTGSIGDIGTSSFYPPHHMTMGEGGAVYTNNALLRQILASFRDWGRDCYCDSGYDNTCGCRFTGQFGRLPFGYDHKYVYSHFGYNLKATDLQAAIGCAQLDKLPSFVEKRKQNFQYLKEGVKDISSISFQKCEPESEPSWFGFLMKVLPDARFTRNDFAMYLEEHGIQTRNLFGGNLVKHPCFDTCREGVDYRIASSLVNTDDFMNNALWIGVYPGMTVNMLERMVEVIREFWK